MTRNVPKEAYSKLLQEFFQKYFAVHDRSAVKNSFITYVCTGRFILIKSVGLNLLLKVKDVKTKSVPKCLVHNAQWSYRSTKMTEEQSTYIVRGRMTHALTAPRSLIDRFYKRAPMPNKKRMGRNRSNFIEILK